MTFVGRALDRFFGLNSSGSSVATELRAGFTTWLTMAYILFVNADILSKGITLEGGTVFAQLLTATALASALGCFLMGVVANYPFGMAPGMGLNAYFAFTVVMVMGIPWQSALAAVFVAGVLFLVISVTGLRTMILNGIPLVLKRATAVGIGLFLAVIGFVNMGLSVDHPATLVTLGKVTDPGPLLGFLGIVLITVAMIFRMRGAILLGIVVVSAIAIMSGAPVFQGQPFAGFSHGIVQWPVWPVDLFMAMDFSNLFTPPVMMAVAGFLFVDFFDTAGTLMGLAEKAGYADEKGHLPRATAAFTADAVATTVGATIGVSPTTTYIESASGIEEGGRTGLTAVVCGVLFLLSIFFWPLASAVPGIATAPALIIVGAFMMSAVVKISWDDLQQSVPAFLTIVGMPLTYSISNGIALGIISYVLIALFSGRIRSVHWTMYVVGGLLAVFLAMTH